MNNRDMSSFLEKNDGVEYIGMVNAKNVIEQRLGCWHFYTDRNLWGKLYRHVVIPMQKALNIHHVKKISLITGWGLIGAHCHHPWWAPYLKKKTI